MNYLYVCTQGAGIAYRDRRIVVQKEERVLASAPIEPLECIEIYGNVQITTQAMQACIKHRINVGMFSATGFYIGNLISAENLFGVTLGYAQTTRTRDRDFCIQMARKMIEAKIHNQKVILRKYTDAQTKDVSNAILYITTMQKKIATVHEIMGIEGSVARMYFHTLGTAFDEEFAFAKRSRRPAADPYNALINFGYAVLQSQIFGKLILRGIHPCMGMVHSNRDNKHALVFDMMEEWRPVIVDSLAIHCLQSHRIRKEHFVYDAAGGVKLTTDGMKIYRKLIEEKYETQSSYVRENMNSSFRSVLKYQVDRMADALLANNPELYVPCRIR